MNPLQPEQIAWIEKNDYFFNVPNRTLTKEDVRYLFAVYSWVDGKNHKPTGCGRCVASAKATVWAQYKKQILEL